MRPAVVWESDTTCCVLSMCFHRSASCWSQKHACVRCHHQHPDHRLGPRRGSRPAVQNRLRSPDRGSHHRICKHKHNYIITLSDSKVRPCASPLCCRYSRCGDVSIKKLHGTFQLMIISILNPSVERTVKINSSVSPRHST